MKKLAIFIFTVIAFYSFTFGQQQATTATGNKVLLWEDGTWVYADSVPLCNIKATTLSKLEIPKTNPKDIIITHTGYTLLYNETHKQASWVAYELTKQETNKTYKRTDKFITDPKVKTGTATDNDYASSGYDRGHLAPASDMGWSATAMNESFYYSNMSPQAPSFNRGVWKRLEELVRTWAVEYSSVYIATGPVLTSDLTAIGSNKVSVPKYYYKAILHYSESGIKAIGFILPNAGSSEHLQQFAVSIDSLEHFVGIDFFPSLPNQQENLIENTLCINCWTWKDVNATFKNEQNTTPSTVQCSATTKTGNRCKRMASSNNGRCYEHL